MEAASEDDQVERESGDEDEGNDEEEIDVEDEWPARKSRQARTRKKFLMAKSHLQNGYRAAVCLLLLLSVCCGVLKSCHENLSHFKIRQK